MKTRRRNTGFTMVELVVVIGIIVLMSGLLVVGLSGLSGRGGYTKTQAVLTSLKAASLIYAGENRAFGNWGSGADVTDMTTFYNDVKGIQSDFDESFKDRRVNDGGVIRYKDGWDNYIRIDRQSARKVTFTSPGDDGTLGNADDLKAEATIR